MPIKKNIPAHNNSFAVLDVIHSLLLKTVDDINNAMMKNITKWISKVFIGYTITEEISFFILSEYLKLVKLISIGIIIDKQFLFADLHK